MKRISLIGRIRYFVNIFIVMQGILLALLTVFFLNRKYMDSWENYSTDNPGITIYLNHIPSEKSRDLENYLYEKSHDEGLFIVRKDTLLNHDGGFGGYRFGICGDISHMQAGQLFMGQEVIQDSQIEELLISENMDSTLGIDTGSIHMTDDIPRFRFGAKVVIKQLSQMIRESKTINGTYRVNGLSEPEKADDFLKGIQNITGL
jgi:hypothetical protein